MKKKSTLTLLTRIIVFFILAFVISGGLIGIVEVGARSGSPEAQAELGRWHDEGILLHTKDKDKAIYWTTKAAAQEYPKAQFNLGLLMEEKRNYHDAGFWYLAAATQDFAAAQNNLAMLYSRGLGVPSDRQKANYWFEKAAQNGNRYAQLSIGIAYANGDGVEKNIQKAANWVRLSAEQDNAPAQDYLAVLYVNGLGVPEDLDAALQWAKRAKSNGYEKAKRTEEIIEELLKSN